MRRLALIVLLSLLSFAAPARKDASVRADAQMAEQSKLTPEEYVRLQLAGDCYYTPTCAEFFKQACKELGFFPAVFATADRMTRCTRIGTAAKYHRRGADGHINEGPEVYRVRKSKKAAPSE